MVEVAEVEYLKVHGRGAGIGELTDPVPDLRDRAGQPVSPQFVRLAADGGGAPGDLGVIPPAAHHLCRRVGHRPGLPADRRARVPHPAEGLAGVLDAVKRHVELVRVASREPGRALGPGAADEHRRAGPLGWLGQRRRVRDRVVLAAEAELLALRCRPQAGDDRELLLVPVEPLAQVRERDRVGGVLRAEPAGAETELHPAAAHVVDLGDRDRQRAGIPERGRAHQRAQPDARSLEGQARQRYPGVGRAGQPADVAHLEVVVGPEERVEAEILGRLRHPEQCLVVRALLRLGEDSQSHTDIFARAAGPVTRGSG